MMTACWPLTSMWPEICGSPSHYFKSYQLCWAEITASILSPPTRLLSCALEFLFYLTLLCKTTNIDKPVVLLRRLVRDKVRILYLAPPTSRLCCAYYWINISSKLTWNHSLHSCLSDLIGFNASCDSVYTPSRLDGDKHSTRWQIQDDQTSTPVSGPSSIFPQPIQHGTRTRHLSTRADYRLISGKRITFLMCVVGICSTLLLWVTSNSSVLLDSTIIQR